MSSVLTAADVRSAYRFILGREPELDIDLDVAAEAFADWRQARDYYLNSAEAKAALLGDINMLPSWVRVSTRFGRQIYLNRSDTGVARNILLTGYHEPAVAAAIGRLLPEDGVFLDVGANVGWFSLMVADRLAHAGRGGRVIAIEGNPLLTPYLGASVIESGLAEVVTVMPYAVSDAAKMLAFRIDTVRNLGGEQVWQPDAIAPGRRRMVPAVCIDELLCDIERLDLIKIDIEGSEPLALRGARAVLEKFRPAVVMEINPEALSSVAGMNSAEMLRLLRDLGYSPHSLEALDTPLSDEEALRVVENAGYADFVFLPILVTKTAEVLGENSTDVQSEEPKQA